MRGSLFAIVAAGALLRLSTWTRVFAGGRVMLDGADGWYHLRRAALALQHWPRVPQFDEWLNAPYGGKIPWAPLVDFLLATLALPWRGGARHALELIGAFTPLVLGIAQLLLIYLLMRDLWNRRAALIATAFAAILPGVVRYTFLGALDHDPFFEVCVAVALWALWRDRIALLTAAIVAAILGWAGALVLIGILACVLVATRERRLFASVATASAIAAIILLPFVLTSVWTTPTFEGLSLLHEAVLVLAAACGAIAAIVLGARARVLFGIAIAGAIASIILVPMSAIPLLRGIAYAHGQNAILTGVAESQPLLALFGTFDPRPFLVRLTILPLVALLLLPAWMFRGSRRKESAFLLGWIVPVLSLALMHSRFSFSAAVATCAFAGALFDELLERFGPARAAMAAVAIALPIIAAYVPLPGWREFHFYSRIDAYRETELDVIGERLANRPNGVVYAPWSYGHWILWRSEKPVVLSPMLNVGQSNFERALGLVFVTDREEAMARLDRWNVRYVVVIAAPPHLASLGAAAGVDPSPFLDDGRIRLDRYLRTIPGRLALAGPFGRFVEIDRSRAMFDGPLGRVPLARVYELTPNSSRSSAR